MPNNKKHYGEVVRTSVILSRETHDALKSMATSKRSMSDIISEAVEALLSKEKAPEVPRRDKSVARPRFNRSPRS